MADLFLTFVLALAASCLLVPPVRWLVLRWGVVDRPNARSSHEAPTPRAGGLAIVLGMVATIPWFVPLNAEVISTALIVAAVTAVSLRDDFCSLSARLLPCRPAYADGAKAESKAS